MFSRQRSSFQKLIREGYETTKKYVVVALTNERISIARPVGVNRELVGSFFNVCEVLT
jgi:hypothetical protein